MFVLRTRFVLLAILASFAAFSLAPPADAAAISIRGHHASSSYSSNTASAYAASVTPSSSGAHPVIPLPARLQKAKAGGSSSGTASNGGKKGKHQKEKNRPKRFDSWESVVARSPTADLPPLLSHRAVHYEPKVIIDGLNDHVVIGRAPEPHHHHHHHHGEVDKVIVKGNNDNVHVNRSPSPHHHHHHGDHVDEVIVKGNNDNVHAKRSPSPRHHHHHGDHIDKVIVKGNNDNVHIRRSPSPHHHHHHDDHVDEVIVKGNNDNVHTKRSPEPHHHHHHHDDHVDEVVVKGNNDNVHVKRFPSPHHHHHHHHDGVDKVIIKGDNDNVHLDKRSIAFTDVEGNEYVVPGEQVQRVVSVVGDNLSEDLRAHAKREDPLVMEGTPGAVDIVSSLIHGASSIGSTGTHLASLVLVPPTENMTPTVEGVTNATWVLNASEKNFTQVYLVPLSLTGTTFNDTSFNGTSVNGTSVNGSAMNGTISNIMAAIADGDLPVALKVSVFDPDSASMVAYCATFDPSPPAPAPLTAERCFAEQSTTVHKSQIFSYTPATGGLRPMWYNGEDDGKDAEGDEADAAPQDPHTPQNADIASVTSDEETTSGDFGNATAPASISEVGSNSTSTDASPSSNSKPRSQNVEMIFTPATPELPADASQVIDDVDSITNGTSTPSTLNSTDNSMLSGAESDSSSTTLSGSTQSTAKAEELSVMIGVAAREASSGTAAAEEAMMTPVSTAPYKWRFRRDTI